jgi:hypothetical protein
MNKLLIASRILKIEGILLLAVAAVHLAVIPELRHLLARLLTPPDFAFVWSPFLLNHAVVGILLIPVGLSTLQCADGVKAGARWSWRLGMTNALTVLSLPVVLVTVMERQYFSAPAFLTGAALICIVGLSMIWPLIWIRLDLRQEP